MTTFENIETKELVIGAGSVLSTPSTTADDLIIISGSDGGITFLNTSSANINFGDAADNDVAYIQYNHNLNNLRIVSNVTKNLFWMNDGVIQLSQATGTTPSLLAALYVSGAIFISGGGLWYKGFLNSYKELAPA